MIEPNDINLVLSPVIVDGEWDGNVTLNLTHVGFPDLSEDDQEALMYTAYKLATSMQFFIDNPRLNEKLDEYATRCLEEQQEQYERGEVLERSGNVVTLAFDTKCEGGVQ